MFTALGTGYGMSYTEVLGLEVPEKDRLLELLGELCGEVEQAFEDAGKPGRRSL